MIKHKLHRLSQSDYENLRYALIEQFEESGQPKVDIYTDTKGIVTLGVGFNVAVRENLETVLIQGIDTQDKHSRRRAA